VQYFGKRYGAPAFEFAKKVRAPVGEKCDYCDEPIVEGDNGILLRAGDPYARSPRGAYHLACYLRPFIGSAAHIEGRCGCPNGPFDNDEEQKLTRREAAQAAFAAHERRQGMKLSSPKTWF
jgi:hypothetical protein